jgi:hypothetical protein
VRVIMEQATKPVCGPARHRDPLYLFACHLEWCNKGRLDTYQELIAALDDCDEDIRKVAEDLLHRVSPRRPLSSAARSGEQK